MNRTTDCPENDFKGIGYSKIGYFKEVRTKIKELERLNVELAQRHNKLEAIINSMSDGLTILDLELNIVFANQVQKSIFPSAALLGQKCHEAFYRRTAPCPECPALRTLAGQETCHGEMLVEKGDFAGRYYEWTTSPIRDQFGQVCEIILLMRDITDRKEYEFKLMQADRMSAIGFLAAGIAHELNNPLASIAGYSEGLLKRLNDPAGLGDEKKLASMKEYLGIVNDEAYRCKKIIRNLVEFSRNSDDDFQAVGIPKIIDDTLALIRQHAKDNLIKVQVKNSLAKGFSNILGNDSQIRYLLLTLFGNAFKAMNDGGIFSVETRNVGNTLEISIADTAAGRPDAPREPLFGQSCLPGDLGDGETVGLSICHSIVRKHRGEFEFKKSPNKDLHITVRFPVLLEERPAE